METSLNSQINSEVLTLSRNGITLTRNPIVFVNNYFYGTHSVYIFLQKFFNFTFNLMI